MANLTPAKVSGLDGHKITRVACGSSHSIAWAELNVAPQILFDPVEVVGTKDPLGSAYVTNDFERIRTKETVGQHLRRQRSSLSRDVLQLRTDEEKQIALNLILGSIRICYARDTLITLLSDLSFTSACHLLPGSFSKDPHLVDCNSKKSLSSCDTKKDNRPKEPFVLSLSKVRLLISLLKLGFEGRLQEQQCEQLCLILIQAAKKDKEVGSIVKESICL